MKVKIKRGGEVTIIDNAEIFVQNENLISIGIYDDKGNRIKTLFIPITEDLFMEESGYGIGENTRSLT